MVSQASAGVVHMDLEGRITLTNRRFGEFTGFGDEELHARHLHELMHPDDRRREKELFDRLVRTGTPFEMESRLLRKDGGEVWVKTSVTVLRDAQDTMNSVVAFMLDVGDAVAAREALELSEGRLRLIIENAREYAIVSMDLQRRVTSWNSGAERLLGYREDEILNQPADLIFAAEDRVAGVPGTGSEDGADRGTCGRRALASAQGRDPVLGQRRDDGDAQPPRRRRLAW